MDKAVIYIHGKNGNKNESEFYKSIFKDSDVIVISENKDNTAEVRYYSANLSVAKKADKTKNLRAGDEVTYTITVKNTSPVATLTNIQVNDDLTKFNSTISELKAGEDRELTTTYTITETDVDEMIKRLNIYFKEMYPIIPRFLIYCD